MSNDQAQRPRQRAAKRREQPSRRGPLQRLVRPALLTRPANRTERRIRRRLGTPRTQVRRPHKGPPLALPARPIRRGMHRDPSHAVREPRPQPIDSAAANPSTMPPRPNG